MLATRVTGCADERVNVSLPPPAEPLVPTTRAATRTLRDSEPPTMSAASPRTSMVSASPAAATELGNVLPWPGASETVTSFVPLPWYVKVVKSLLCFVSSACTSSRLGEHTSELQSRPQL